MDFSFGKMERFWMLLRSQQQARLQIQQTLKFPAD